MSLVETKALVIGAPSDRDWYPVFTIFKNNFDQTPHPENLAETSWRRQRFRRLAGQMKTPHQMAQFAHHQDHQRLEVVKYDSTVVGFCLFGRESLKPAGVRAGLKLFAVDPEIQGLGIGREMLNLLIRPRKVPRRCAIYEVSFLASEHDLRTQEFLSKAGFCFSKAVRGRRERFYKWARRTKGIHQKTSLEGGHD